MLIKGKEITLRAIEVDDLELLSKWANQPELWEKLGGWHFPYSKKSTEQWILNIDNNDIHKQIYAIVSEEGKLIGTANITEIDWKNKNAFHGMMLGDTKSRGKGYAQDVVMAIMRFAFDELGLNRLDGDMIASNEVSINFYTKKCGWEIEGVKKDWFYRKGRFFDKIIVGITKSKYKNFCKEIGYWD
tara:strand:- start:1242 stop:1802 length:561 start_codon:yes stop_codon:yes gene_type:complete